MNAKKIFFGIITCGTLIVASCTTSSDNDLYENGVNKKHITKGTDGVRKSDVTKGTDAVRKKDVTKGPKKR
jgi:hypothetical protein